MEFNDTINEVTMADSTNRIIRQDSNGYLYMAGTTIKKIASGIIPLLKIS